MKLKIVLEESDEGGFTAHVPALPGASAKGRLEKRPWGISGRQLIYTWNP